LKGKKKSQERPSDKFPKIVSQFHSKDLQIQASLDPGNATLIDYQMPCYPVGFSRVNISPTTLPYKAKRAMFLFRRTSPAFGKVAAFSKDASGFRVRRQLSDAGQRYWFIPLRHDHGADERAARVPSYIPGKA
jgi:hypothetical protein